MHCHACRQPATRVCSHCRAAAYCSEACAQQDWVQPSCHAYCCGRMVSTDDDKSLSVDARQERLIHEHIVVPLLQYGERIRAETPMHIGAPGTKTLPAGALPPPPAGWPEDDKFVSWEFFVLEVAPRLSLVDLAALSRVYRGLSGAMAAVQHIPRKYQKKIPPEGFQRFPLLSELFLDNREDVRDEHIEMLTSVRHLDLRFNKGVTGRIFLALRNLHMLRLAGNYNAGSSDDDDDESSMNGDDLRIYQIEQFYPVSWENLKAIEVIDLSDDNTLVHLQGRHFGPSHFKHLPQSVSLRGLILPGTDRNNPRTAGTLWKKLLEMYKEGDVRSVEQLQQRFSSVTRLALIDVPKIPYRFLSTFFPSITALSLPLHIYVTPRMNPEDTIETRYRSFVASSDKLAKRFPTLETLDLRIVMTNARTVNVYATQGRPWELAKIRQGNTHLVSKFVEGLLKFPLLTELNLYGNAVNFGVSVLDEIPTEHTLEELTQLKVLNVSFCAAPFYNENRFYNESRLNTKPKILLKNLERLTYSFTENIADNLQLFELSNFKALAFYDDGPRYVADTIDPEIDEGEDNNKFISNVLALIDTRRVRLEVSDMRVKYSDVNYVKFTEGEVNAYRKKLYQFIARTSSPGTTDTYDWLAKPIEFIETPDFFDDKFNYLFLS